MFSVLLVSVYKNCVALPPVGMKVLFTVEGDDTYPGSFENGAWFDRPMWKSAKTKKRSFTGSILTP